MRIVLAAALLLNLLGCASFESTLEKLNVKHSQSRVFQVNTAWIRQTTSSAPQRFRKLSRMSPILTGELVIQGNGLDAVVAYNRENGQERWRLPIANGVEPSAALIKDRLFLGASDGNFYSLAASTGQVQWSFSTKAENLAAPLLENGVVYFLAGNNVFYALDAATGRQLWLYSRQDTSQFSIRGGSQAAFKNGMLYVGFSDGSLVALDAKSGSVKWEVQLNKNKKFRDVDATPVIEDDRLYVASYDDKLFCISTDKGEILWRVDGGGYSAITIYGDKIFYPTSQGEVLALKKSNGEKLWSYKLKEGIATQVKVFNGALVFGESQGFLRFLDPNSGKSIGGFEPGRGVLSAPEVDIKRNRVYFVSGEALLYAIDAAWVKEPIIKD